MSADSALSHICMPSLCFALSSMETHCGNCEAATADEALKREQFKTLQMLVNKLNECRKVFSFPSQIITESLY